MNVIETSRLHREFRHGVRALDDVTLGLRRDVITGLLGRNGAGKTTLMSVLTGQDFATSGTVRVFGEDPLENERVLSQMCFIRESQQYPNNFRIGHVLAAGRALYPHWDDEMAARLVEQFELPGRREVNKYSRGMRSRVGILIGLASQAPITFFDEPYLGLDATSRQQFYDLLIADYAENPRTIVLSTHLIDEVAGLLEDVVVLDGGRVAMTGTAEELARRGSVLTGPSAAVIDVAGTAPVLHREDIGAYLTLTVDAPYDADLRTRAEARGVEARPLSLQSLVVQVGSRPSTGTHTTSGASA